MPRAMDPRLVMAHERANPATCYMVDVSVPNVGQVLRRAADQFLQSPPKFSETPASSLNADPAGALTLNSTSATLANFPTADDFTTTHIDAAGLTEDHVRGLCWTVDPAFGVAKLRSVTVRIKRFGTTTGALATNRVGLQIYRRDNIGPDFAPFLLSAWTKVLANEVWVRPAPADWVSNVANPVFDLSGQNVVLKSGDGPNAKTEYYIVLSIDQGKDDMYLWARDRTTARTIAGVGTFADRQWRVPSGTIAGNWKEDLTLPAAVPVATLTIEHFSPTSQAVYALDMGAVPSVESIGRVVFERGLPTGTSAALELSTAGSGGPWVAVTDGTVVTTKQQTYHLRLTMNAPANRNIAPHVSAMGLRFRTEVDVSAEATVQEIPQAIDVPWCAAGIGEGSVSIVRTGARDFRDAGSELATTAPVTQLEVDVRLGSRHPGVPRDAWLLLDRATVNNRTPSSGAEQFNLLSALRRTKRKVPARVETFNTLHTVTSCSTTSGFTTLHVTPAIPLVGTVDAYLHQGYYMRVRSSAQPGVETGFVTTIYNNSGGGHDLLQFTDDATDNTQVLPNNLVAGDVIEIHSARFARPIITWEDTDLADIWWEILTVWLDIPPEQIGRGDMGHGGRAGIPPRVDDIEPGDPTTQAKRLVTIALKSEESGDALLNQISFLLGGATVDIGSQIVFRQIYPLRNADGAVTVMPDPIADTFDVRDTIGLETPTGVEQRIPQLACNYGVDTTAGGDTTAAKLTAVTADADAMAYLDAQPIDDVAASEVPDEIARWCFNSADGGLYLASKVTEMVVRAASTGLRVWSWGSIYARPRLVIGDRVAVVTDQYTDFDPSRLVPISGPWSFVLTLVSVSNGGRSFRGWLQSLSDGLPIKGGPGTLPVVPGPSGPSVTATVRISKNADRDAEDVYITAISSLGENVAVYYRDGELSTSPVYRLCVSGVDPTFTFITSGAEVGPLYWFMRVDGVGSPVHILAGALLARDQVKRVMVGVEAQYSHAFAWLPWTLSLMEKPWNESLSLTWDDATGKLRAIVVGGAHAVYETVDIADNDAFTSPHTFTGAVTDGGTAIYELAVSSSNRGIAWYARAVPNNGAAGAGLAGEPQTASIFVPQQIPQIGITVTPGPSSYSIAYSAVGTLTMSSDGGSYSTPGASPIVVTRDGSAHTRDFKATIGIDKKEAHADIPALGAGGTQPLIDSFYSPSNGQYNFAQHTTTDIIDLVWSARNAPSGATFNLEWSFNGGGYTTIAGVSSPYSHLAGGAGGHGLDLVNGGTLSPMRYTLIMKDSGGNELTAATLEVAVDHV